MSVVVTNTTLAGVDASDVTGRVFAEAEFEGSRLIVVGTDNKTEIHLVFDVRSVIFDFDALLDAMTGRAREELRALLADPDNPDSNRAFRNALRGPARPQSLPPYETAALTEGSPLLVDFRLVAYKDDATHSITDVFKIPSLKIDLAGLLADDKDLVTALAHHLADPRSVVLREGFLDGARAAIDVGDLSDYIAGFSEPVTVRGHNGRLTTTGPAVPTIGHGNRTTVTPEVRTRRARERGIHSMDDLMPPTPARFSFNDSTYNWGLSGEDNPPPSSEIEERTMRGPEIEGPSVGGPGGF